MELGAGPGGKTRSGCSPQHLCSLSEQVPGGNDFLDTGTRTFQGPWGSEPSLPTQAREGEGVRVCAHMPSCSLCFLRGRSVLVWNETWVEILLPFAA